MKKIFFIVLFIYISNVEALGSIHISKRDINTNDFINDCDFLLYDNNGDVVDSWIPNSSIHISNVPNGVYKLVERPKVMSDYSDYLSQIYMLNVKDEEVLELNLYNDIVDAPVDLKYMNFNMIGFFVFLIGIFIVIYYWKFNYI